MSGLVDDSSTVTWEPESSIQTDIFFWHMSYIIFEYKSDEIDLNVRVVVRTFYYNKLLYDYTSNNVV